MKQLFAGIVLIIIIGVGGLLYRNTFEHPYVPPQAAQVCSQEVKQCPDGTSVGRTGPSCAYAPCALPNAQDAATGISFVIPPGYVANASAIGAEQSLRAVFDKQSKGPVPNSIIIRRYLIEVGKTATETILANTTFESSGEKAKSINQFLTKTFGGKTFLCVQLERFEGQIHTACYLSRASDVIRFEVLEKDVLNWTDPKLKVDELPEHKALYFLLNSVTF